MPRNAIARLVRALALAGDATPDGHFLRRVAADRDREAFERIVRRHADLVWAACRATARQDADAEDAFQATFLALARSAGRVRGPHLAGWLHRVGVNAALKQRLKAGRTPTATPAALAAVPAGPDPAADVGAAHEELARLPDRLRLPVLLCDLEGRTHAEAAALLGWPVGTVSGRLSRARALLRDRLTRRGVTGAAVAAGFGAAPAGACRAAIEVAAGGAVPSAAVSTLTLQVIAMSSFKQTVAVVAVLAVGAAGGGTALVWGQGGRPVKGPPAEPPAVAAKPVVEEAKPVPKGEWSGTAFANITPNRYPGDRSERVNSGDLSNIDDRADQNYNIRSPRPLASDDVRTRLRKERLRAAERELGLNSEVFRTGAISGGEFEGFLANFRVALRDVPRAADELFTKPKDLLPYYEDWVRNTKTFEALVNSRILGGITRPAARYAALKDRIDAELALIALKEKIAKK